MEFALWLHTNPKEYLQLHVGSFQHDHTGGLHSHLVVGQWEAYCCQVHHRTPHLSQDVFLEVQTLEMWKSTMKGHTTQLNQEDRGPIVMSMQIVLCVGLVEVVVLPEGIASFTWF